MPSYVWPKAPIEVVQGYEKRRSGRGDAGALIVWAAWTVEGLHYLDDLDELYFRENPPISIHSSEIVTIAHARWATGSAITSLDLCAAALGREFCGSLGLHEIDLRDFDPSGKDKKKITARRAALPNDALAWTDSVLKDERYRDVQGARNPLTHSRLIRHLHMGGPRHTQFVIAATGNILSVRDLVCLARDLATEHVAAFLKVVETL